MQSCNRSRLLRPSAVALVLALSCWQVAPASAQEAACEPVATVDRPPPPLPVYTQPPVPGPGYIWAPGYWHWDEDASDYYWTPGTWVQPPRPDLLWTPGYWAWVGGLYLFHRGYWGTHVGFYGGVNYGYGYAGSGYEGGRWEHGNFFYNRTVNNLAGATITNVYAKTIVVSRTANNVSYNGGHGGIDARPTPEEKAFAKEQHFAPTPLQQRHADAARNDRSLFAGENHGKPPVAATAHPGVFNGAGVSPTRPAGEQQPPAPANHLPPAEQRKPAANGAPAGGHEPTGERSSPPPNGHGAAPQQTTAPSGAPASKPNEPRPGAGPAVEKEKPAGAEQRPHPEEKSANPPAPEQRHEGHAPPLKPQPEGHAPAPKPQSEGHTPAPKLQPEGHAPAPKSRSEDAPAHNRAAPHPAPQAPEKKKPAQEQKKRPD